MRTVMGTTTITTTATITATRTITGTGITTEGVTITTTTIGADSSPRRTSLGTRLDGSWLVLGSAVAFTVYVAMIPLVFLVWQSFRTPQTAAEPAVWTLAN